MVSPRLDPSDSGYAAAAAVAISLALALVAAAVVQVSSAELRLARADMRRTKSEYALAGAHALAIADVLADGRGLRMRWTLSTDAGAVEVLAEPEAPKLASKAGAVLDDATWSRLGVSDPSRIRSLLAAASIGRARALIQVTEGSPLWRACALSVLSPYGRGKTVELRAAATPAAGALNWRPGEVWRIRASGADGWVDDRIVRFTGAPDRPAAVVERDFNRGWNRGEPCQALIAAG